MPNLYMGRGGIDGLFGGPLPSGGFRPDNPSPEPMPGRGQVPGSPPTGKGKFPPYPRTPSQANAPTPTPTPGGNVLSAQSVRASGPSQGYDPAYLQNLATAIGGLFSRPSGSMSFNPLGNLSEISPPSGIGGNAPGFGEPLTWLQQALNGLGFSWQPPKPPPNPLTRPPNVGGGGRGRAPIVPAQ